MVVRRHLLCDAAALPPSLAQIGINCRRQAPTGPKSDFFTASCPFSAPSVPLQCPPYLVQPVSLRELTENQTSQARRPENLETDF
jgi:hypothetical protein